MYEYNHENAIITLDEACEQLQIGKSSLYQLMRSKQLKAFKIGRCWKVPVASIEEYIKQQCQF